MKNKNRIEEKEEHSHRVEKPTIGIHSSNIIIKSFYANTLTSLELDSLSTTKHNMYLSWYICIQGGNLRK